MTVFGERELRNNQKSIRNLMTIALGVFKFELSNQDFSEVLWGRTESSFE